MEFGRFQARALDQAQAAPPLTAKDVHVWAANLDDPPVPLESLVLTLSSEEVDRAERFHFDLHRNRYVASRGILRMILSRYTATAPELLAFCYGPYGKPGLPGGENGIQFNLSHSEGIALYGFALGRVIGVDVERVRHAPDAAQIAARFFTAGERSALAALPPTERTLAFIRCWTRKEAYLKAIGEGLHHPLDQVEVTFDGGSQSAVIQAGERAAASRRWFICETRPYPGFVGVFCVEGGDDGLRLSCWRCDR